MSELKAVGCNVILDSSGTMLAEGVLQQPYMIKPNEHELSELLHSPDLLKNQDLMLNHCVDAATQLHQQGIDHVLVSLGEHGLIWISDKVALHSMPPKVSIRSTVGAGDSVVAGFVWSQLNNFSPTQAIAFCTAMGTYAVSQVGVGVKAIEEVQSILDEVSVRTI
jgi:1-phosphofructokinase